MTDTLLASPAIRVVAARAILLSNNANTDDNNDGNAYVCEKTCALGAEEPRCQKIPKFGGKFADGSRGMLMRDYEHLEADDLKELMDFVLECYGRQPCEHVSVNYTDDEGDSIHLKSVADWTHFLTSTETSVQLLQFAFTEVLRPKNFDPYELMTQTCRQKIAEKTLISSHTGPSLPKTADTVWPPVVTQQPKNMATSTDTMTSEQIKDYVREQLNAAIPVIKAQLRAELMSTLVPSFGVDTKSADKPAVSPQNGKRERKTSKSSKEQKKHKADPQLQQPCSMFETKHSNKIYKSSKKDNVRKVEHEEMKMTVNDFEQFWQQCKRCKGAAAAGVTRMVNVVFVGRHKSEVVCDACLASHVPYAVLPTIRLPLTTSANVVVKPKRMAAMFDALMGGYATALTRMNMSLPLQPTPSASVACIHTMDGPVTKLIWNETPNFLPISAPTVTPATVTPPAEAETESPLVTSETVVNDNVTVEDIARRSSETGDDGSSFVLVADENDDLSPPDSETDDFQTSAENPMNWSMHTAMEPCEMTPVMVADSPQVKENEDDTENSPDGTVGSTDTTVGSTDTTVRSSDTTVESSEVTVEDITKEIAALSTRMVKLVESRKGQNCEANTGWLPAQTLMKQMFALTASKMNATDSLNSTDECRTSPSVDAASLSSKAATPFVHANRRWCPPPKHDVMASLSTSRGWVPKGTQTTMPPPQPVIEAPLPVAEYPLQMAVLERMGFKDIVRNADWLRRANGVLETALDGLTGEATDCNLIKID